jgi:hypothetical protein
MIELMAEPVIAQACCIQVGPARVGVLLHDRLAADDQARASAHQLAGNALQIAAERIVCDQLAIAVVPAFELAPAGRTIGSFHECMAFQFGTEGIEFVDPARQIWHVG